MNGILTKYHVSKNLWSYNPSTTRNGVTLSYDGTKINFSGQCNGSDNIETNISLPAGTYTIAANANRSPVTDSTYCILIYKSGVVECGISNTRAAIGKNSFTLENDESNIKMRIRIQNGVDYDGFYIQPMMNTGSEILPFEPHGDTWNDIPYSKLENATDVVTNLPVMLYTDGETDISLLLKGNTETSGNPSPQNPVTVDGVGNKTANIFNGIYSGFVFTSDSEQPTKWIVNTSTNGKTAVIKVSPNTQYTIRKIDESNRFFVGETPTIPTASDTSIDKVTGISNNTVTFTTKSDTNYIMVYVSTSTEAATPRLMVNYGSEALPFEPYGYKILISANGTTLTPVYLGDVQTTRLIRKVVLTGNETGGEYTYNTHTFRYSRQNLGIPTRKSDTGYLCTHFKRGGSASNLLDGETDWSSYLYFKLDSCTTIDDWYNYLKAQYAAGTPVTVWYVLDTAETSIIYEPLMKIDEYADSIDSTQSGIIIPTTDSTATIDVDTTVKPSEIDLTYHGWHEHEPLKRENGQWE